MNDQPSSGNRWEPTSSEPSRDDAGTPLGRPVTPGAGPGPGPEGATTQQPAYDAPPAPARRSRLTAGRIKLAAAAAVIFLGGGAVGAGVAHAVSGDDAVSGVPGQGTFDRDGDGPPDGEHRDFDGDGDRGGFPGQPPQQGGTDGSGSGTGSGAADGDDT